MNKTLIAIAAVALMSTQAFAGSWPNGTSLTGHKIVASTQRDKAPSLACKYCSGNGTSLNGQKLNGQKLNGQKVNGQKLNGQKINGTSAQSAAYDVHAVTLADGTRVRTH